jgi:hypothetical protein
MDWEQNEQTLTSFAPPKLAIPWAAKIGAKVWPADASADAALATIQFRDRPNVVVFFGSGPVAVHHIYLVVYDGIRFTSV